MHARADAVLHHDGMAQAVPRPMGGVLHDAGPALQWAGLLDSELVTLMEAPAAMLRSWLPFGEQQFRTSLVM